MKDWTEMTPQEITQLILEKIWNFDVDELDESPECGQPCSPDDACDECADYWNRMEQEGYWDPRGKWTDKGWNEITKI